MTWPGRQARLTEDSSRPEFWHERWENDRIGFHEADGNRFQHANLDAFVLPATGTVLVPLCGKTPDLTWLAERGYRVLGVELSPKACADYFAERGLEVTPERLGPFVSYASGPVRLLCGDVFDLSPQLLATLAPDLCLIYDRAALVALPESTRRRYAALLADLLSSAPGDQMLLITFDYPQDQMQGPPFAITPAEVETLYRDFEITVLEDAVLSEGPGGDAGPDRVKATTYRLVQR